MKAQHGCKEGVTEVSERFQKLTYGAELIYTFRNLGISYRKLDP